MMIMQLCCISAIEGMDAGLLPAVSYALQKDLGLRLTDLAVLTLAQAVSQALAAPIWGVMADRRVIRRKTLLSLGAFFQAGANVSSKSNHALLGFPTKYRTFFFFFRGHGYTVL